MKSYFFFILLIFITSCEKGSTDLGTCYFTDQVSTLYEEDVYRLLFQEIYLDSAHPDRSFPLFNLEKKMELLQAFQSVYDMDTPERDTIVHVFAIHTYPSLGMRSIALKVDTASDEVSRLIAGIPSGNIILDSIISTFKFTSITTSLFYPEFNWLTITSEKSWNLIPIWEKLESLDFIYLADLGGGSAGDGNTIVMDRGNSSIILDFSIGWGDCPSGCIQHRHWIFDINNNCQAQLKEVFSE